MRLRGLAAALLLAAASCRSPAEARDETRELSCNIERVSDGDSLTCADGERLRLLSIDAPEMAQEPYGAEARAALLRLAPLRSTLRLELDQEERDPYGRILAYAWLADGRMLNEEMARQGYVVALVYSPNRRYEPRIRAAVHEARAAGRGLWATPAFNCPPVDFRAGRCR